MARLDTLANAKLRSDDPSFTEARRKAREMLVGTHELDLAGQPVIYKNNSKRFTFFVDWDKAGTQQEATTISVVVDIPKSLSPGEDFVVINGIKYLRAP